MKTLTIKDIIKAFKENNIPDDCTIVADTSWECDPVDMCELYYDEYDNLILLAEEKLPLFKLIGMKQLIGDANRSVVSPNGYYVYYVDPITRIVSRKDNKA